MNDYHNYIQISVQLTAYAIQLESAPQERETTITNWEKRIQNFYNRFQIFTAILMISDDI